MGIINVTPDSFSDGGEFLSHRTAIEHGLKLVEEGADILDVGGESTRPGAEDISVDEELRRVMPVVEALVARNLPVSVDTQKTRVMEEALAAGACMINDVNAMQAEGALEVIAASAVAICLMHRQGTSKTMQLAPHYDDVVQEVRAFLLSRAQAAVIAGIPHSRIVLDPGFGFGKTQTHNIELINGLREFSATGFPILVGLSRKRMLGELTGRSSKDRLAASLTAAIIAVQNGAAIVRVHDVAATKDALTVLIALAPFKERA
ncbi:MAG: dihydropteroate synthase [Pseudomonadota bacterium]